MILIDLEDYEMSPEQLEGKYDRFDSPGHPAFTLWDWKQAVASTSTLCGYWEWLAYQLEIRRCD